MLYLYGLVLPTTDVPDDVDGLGAGGVRLVGLGQIAALTSEIPEAEVIGMPAEVRAYTAVLDGVAAEHPVLPLKFGTAVLDEGAVDDAFPAERRASLAAALRRLDGLAQFTLQVRYVTDTVLTELITEDTEIAELRSFLQVLPTDTAYQARIRLGELIVQGFARKREHDVALLRHELAPFAIELQEHETELVEDVVEVAVLVRRTELTAFEAALEKLAASAWGRATFRLVGPQAPYDFVDLVGEG
ncbi:GvpL/GvpF family gas vesicle protein [Promicromonospora kroppenstedtii]|uniref:GvpL/GvpF family gas vesicle protein n=1 Tax=Promicromonospora kroppenstedtii TaxID=440482 RepID=UPI0004B1800A|nr:GvpL/GvpF family gas vesicle protein [Promicromonospora kroppenstedtii]